VVPVPQSSGPPFLSFNPQVLLPQGGNTYGGTGYVNSGFISQGGPAGDTFALKFTAPGTYQYLCALHADQGMMGTITVTGAPAPSASPAAGTPTGTIGAPSTGTGPAPSGGHGGWFAPLLSLAAAGALLALAGTRLAWSRRP
jgi:hypothetical protein